MDEQQIRLRTLELVEAAFDFENADEWLADARKLELYITGDQS